MAEQEKSSNPVRFTFVVAFVIVWCALICGRLAQLQIVQHREYAELALERQQVTQDIAAPRGIIYDSHMDELAANVPVNMVVAEPLFINSKEWSSAGWSHEKQVETAARQLASILNMDFGKLHARMTRQQHHLIVKHRIDPKDESRIEALIDPKNKNRRINGIYLLEESMRLYPNKELGSQTLGFVNMNGVGGAGIEMQYDRQLKGVPGQISLDIDARHQSFRCRVEPPPVQGNSLVLSIDKLIQYIAEHELGAGVTKYNALSGTAIVMESDTGRILALAGFPNFNSNTYNEAQAELWRNRAVSDYFEPGSTFKVVVASAALEEGLTRVDELIDCQMGAITVGRHVFHDHKAYGMLTFGQILEFSSNVGAAKLGLRLEKERLYGYLRRFGFGSVTGVDLPAESIGLVRDWHQWSGLSVAAISFGQEVGVTSMQILGAINAIANGGYRVQPSVVDRIINQNGDLVSVHTPERTRVMKPETAAAVRDAFEGVVVRGTGRNAALEGYRAAGKTGTAQKIVDGRYSSSKYVASFIGFAPLPKARITVLVQINEPKNAIYGGEVSAPIFRAISQGALLALGVPPDQPMPMATPKIDRAIPVDTRDYRPDATPLATVAGTQDTTETSELDVIRVRVASASVSVPDFTGMSKRTVVERGHEIGLRIQTSGTGNAVSQIPPAGTLLAGGETCIVTFSVNKPAQGPKHAVPVPGNVIAAGRQEVIRR